ncbi:hypothetical protein EDD18DRAFT_1362560 [Armillaria luteobubalina]|uniref:DUF6532 domain-containing protein n=1 Tax=Armillaria luteobubalina TaxID=153913 RepID=A0AA39UDK3_9AGAR|nr:hypothetical protein EDD18DRAFT_1362560 [Armillaria luteobubalina]
MPPTSQLDAKLEPRPFPPNTEFTSTPSSFPPADTQTRRPFWVDLSLAGFNAYYHFPDLSTSSNEHNQLNSEMDDQSMADTIRNVQVAPSRQDGLGASLPRLPSQQAVDPKFSSNGSDSESGGKDDTVSSISSKAGNVTSGPVHIPLPTRKRHKLTKMHTQHSESSSANEEDSANEDDNSVGDCNKENLKPTVTHRNLKKRSCTIKDIPDTLQQDVLKRAYNEYKRMLTLVNGFPIDNAEHQEVTDMMVDAWDAALTGLVDEVTRGSIDDPLSAELNLIWDHGSQFHGQLKDIIRPLLVDIYGFQDIKKLQNPNKEHIEVAKAANRDLINALKSPDDPMRFIYENPLDHTAKGRIFQNEIFQVTINMNWFGQRERVRSSWFAKEKKIPLPTIALVAAAVNCAIDKWSTGTHKTCLFQAEMYKTNYKNLYLDSLNRWQFFLKKQE